MKALPNNNKPSFMDNAPYINPLSEFDLKSGLRFIINNEKPATHFIEVYKGKNTGRVYQNPCLSITELTSELNSTIKHFVIETIAIFKIRLK